MHLLFWVSYVVTIGGNILVWGLFGLTMYWRGKKEGALWFIFGLAVDFFVNKLLKFTFLSPRPSQMVCPPPFYYEEFGTPYGFPSSHAQTISFVACYLTLTSKKKRRKVALIFSILVTLVSYSRVLLRYHYWYDVIGGILFGLSMGVSFWKIKEVLRHLFVMPNNFLLLSSFLSLIVGALLYSFFPLYPTLVTGSVMFLLPCYGLSLKLNGRSTPPDLTYRLLGQLGIGIVSLIPLGFGIYHFYELGMDAAVLFLFFIGELWVFLLFPLCMKRLNRCE